MTLACFLNNAQNSQDFLPWLENANQNQGTSCRVDLRFHSGNSCQVVTSLPGANAEKFGLPFPPSASPHFKLHLKSQQHYHSSTSHFAGGIADRRRLVTSCRTHLKLTIVVFGGAKSLLLFKLQHL